MIVNEQSAAQKMVDELYGRLERRRGASTFGSCPVDITSAFSKLCLAQSCGKCAAGRIGLEKMSALLDKVLDGEGSMEDLAVIEKCAKAVYDSADCAIGFEAARLVIDGMGAFRDDYISHIEKGICTENFKAVPCVQGCPSNVDIPGYIALIKAGRYADAVRVIRKDNPLPGVCGLICEHPCESYCRRNIVDAPLNIRGLKWYAVEKAGEVPAPACAPSNGKKVAIIGGGPAGLTAAYYLQLKGYQTTIFDAHKKLGGMLRYGIPAYRLPDKYLDADIDVILSTGVEVKLETAIGRDITFKELRAQYDCVYISIGAQSGNSLGVPGDDAEGVLSAVKFLDAAGNGTPYDLKGKRVIVVGGGNVAMDSIRTAKRLGAASVTCVYRRRIADMTALPEEIIGLQAEGCEIKELLAPVSVETADGKVIGLVGQPQISGAIDGGRPKPMKADKDAFTLPCDIIIAAIGQSVDSAHFEESGVAVNRKKIKAGKDGIVPGLEGVFTGGDSFTGPATAIRAINSGKVAAANIDAYFGFNTEISSGVEIPAALDQGKPAWGRVNMPERDSSERQNDMELVEVCLTDQEAMQESSRCLRCDHFGCGSFRGGRNDRW